jgi:hypothetical protein
MELTLSWRKFETLTEAPPPYLIYGLARGSVGLLIGAKDARKSTLAQNLAVDLAAGRPFEPLPGGVEGAQKVLLCDWESPGWLLKKQLAAMTCTLPPEQQEAVRNNLAVYSAMRKGVDWLDLADEKQLPRLGAAIEKFAPALVIVDTLTAAFELEDLNHNSEVTKRVMTPLRKLAKGYDTAILVIHHTRDRSNRAHGASATTRPLPAVYLLENKGGRLRLCVQHIKDGEREPVPLVIDDSTLRYSLPSGIVARMPDQTAWPSLIDAALCERKPGDEMNMDDAAGVLRANGYTKRQAYTLIKQGVPDDAPIYVEGKGGRGNPYRIGRRAWRAGEDLAIAP